MNRDTVDFSDFSDLPYSRAGLVLSLNYKKNSYDLEKIVLFSCELLLSSFLQFRSFFLKKKKYFRKSSAPYSPILVFGTNTRLPNFKKKKFKFNALSNFLFKKVSLFYNTTPTNKFLTTRHIGSQPKFLLKTLRNFLKKKSRKFFNKLLKKKNKFSKSYLLFSKKKNKNLYVKLSMKFLKIKRKRFKKKNIVIRRNVRLMRFFNWFFANLFFKKIKLKKKPSITNLSRY